MRTPLFVERELELTRKISPHICEPYVFEPLFTVAANWLEFCYRAGNGDVAFADAKYEQSQVLTTKALSPFDTLLETNFEQTRSGSQMRTKIKEKHLFTDKGELYDPKKLQKVHQQMKRVRSLPLSTMSLTTATSVPELIELPELGEIQEYRRYQPIPGESKPIIDVQLENGETQTLTDFTTVKISYKPFTTRISQKQTELESRFHSTRIPSENTFPLYTFEQNAIPAAVSNFTRKSIENMATLEDFARISEAVQNQSFNKTPFTKLSCEYCLPTITAKRAVLIEPADFERGNGLQFNGVQEQFMEKVSNPTITMKVKENETTIEQCLNEDFFIPPRIRFSYEGDLEVPVLALPARFGAQQTMDDVTHFFD